jgi:hypothetical protein
MKMPYKQRIKPKSLKDRVRVGFFILIAITAFLSPFYGEYKEARGRSEVQRDIIRAIETQDNIKLDKLIITTSNGKGNKYSVVFPAENWEG